MTASLKAGAAYFAVVFVFAFLLGAIRVSIVEPPLGALCGTALETPLVLGISWIACGYAVRIFSVPPGGVFRAVMGGAALALLLATEMSLGRFFFDRPLEQQVLA